MTTHTPAPWAVHDGMPDCVTFEGRHGTENLFLQNVDGYYACQNEADAKLIAAAPDLLAAVRFLLTASAPMTSRQHECWPGLQAAFARATGAAT